MSTKMDIEHRLRAACPVSEDSPPTLSSVLARIERAEQEPPTREWRRGIALPLILAAIVLVGAGGGALLLRSGGPLPPAFVLPANPNEGLGRTLAPSLKLLPMRVADPAGGPPWAMRVIRTTRGLACLQAGRVVDGRLGGVGNRYAFKNDGRFHPFLPADSVAIDSCATVDAGGHAFQPNAPAIVTADGLSLAGENLWPGERVHCDLPGQQDWGVRCPQADLRQVAMGLLGADAASIRVSAPGRNFTVAPDGPDGAYLIVLPAPANSNSGAAGGLYAYLHHRHPRTPALAVLTVTYRDGSHCQIPATRAGQQCSPKGLTGSSGAPVTRAQVRAVLHVSYRALVKHPTPPLMMTGHGGRSFQGRMRTGPRGIGEELPGPALVISFDAPVPAPNIQSAYDVELEPRQVAGCPTPVTIIAQPTSHTIVTGQPVQITVPLESTCHTSYSGRVFFASSSGSYSEARSSDNAGEGPLYEVIASGFGPGPHSTSFPTVGRFQISVP